MSEKDPHSSFIKTPKQLIVTFVLAFAVPVIGIVFIVQLATNRPEANPNAMKPDVVADRLRPVGHVEFGPPGASSQVAEAAQAGAPAPAAIPAPPPPAGGQTKSAAASGGNVLAEGKKVFEGTCFACHATGAAGAPKVGDKAAWAPRIKQGMNTLLNAALHGLNAMPPKGGNPSLTDAQVHAAIEYMVSQSK